MDGLMMNEPLLLSSLLWRTERLFHDKKIVTRLGTGEYHAYTYRDYGLRVRRLANVLQRLGVRPGDRVGTLAWNHYRHFELYMAIPAVQAVCHTINLRLFPEQQRFIVNHAGDSILFLDADQIPLVETFVRDGAESVKAFVVMCDGDLPETTLSPVYSYEQLMAESSDDFEFTDFDENTAAAMCYTSATTGDPKGVIYRHRAIVLQSMCLAMHDKLNMSEDQVWLEVAPMFHCNGWNIPHTALRQKQGQPIPLMKTKVLDEEGLELPWDGQSVGDFWVRSPFTASAYFDDERTKESMIGGWFRTGDVGCIDPDGYMILKDRSKDLIKSGGEWISSIDLENALMAHPKVREATVVSVPHDKWLERPLACVVPSDPSLTENELRDYLAVSFAKWWIPDRFVLVSEVPKTSVGKYNKKEVRALIAAGGVAAVEESIGIDRPGPAA